jgi:ferredoxin
MVAKFDFGMCGGCETCMEECPTEAITTAVNLRDPASGPLDEWYAEKTLALTEGGEYV